jgi:hypothetical protein
MMLQIARFTTGSLAALGHLTAIDIVLAALGLAIDLTALATLRLVTSHRPMVAPPRTEYDEAA